MDFFFTKTSDRERLFTLHLFDSQMFSPLQETNKYFKLILSMQKFHEP